MCSKKTKQQELFSHRENEQILVEVASYLIRPRTSTDSVTSPAVPAGMISEAKGVGERSGNQSSKARVLNS